jgi:hypothetical protein
VGVQEAKRALDSLRTRFSAIATARDDVLLYPPLASTADPIVLNFIADSTLLPRRANAAMTIAFRHMTGLRPQYFLVQVGSDTIPFAMPDAGDDP